jgi:molybdate transport system regulatory protein
MVEHVLANPVILQFGENEISQRRLELLKAIDAHPSISAAAKAVGMTYKAAWDAVDAINNMAGQPIVSVQHGGKGGGGALLTEEGRKILKDIERFESLQKSFFLAMGSDNPTGSLQILRRLEMKTSARNCFYGTVDSIKEGPVNCEIALRLPGGDLIHAIITSQSVKDLGLSAGKEAYALIKATWIILAKSDNTPKTSARNNLCGTVSRIQEGPVNTEVVINLSGQNTLTAMITSESLHEMHILKGDQICALIKASHIIIGVN